MQGISQYMVTSNYVVKVYGNAKLGNLVYCNDKQGNPPIYGNANGCMETVNTGISQHVEILSGVW